MQKKQGKSCRTFRQNKGVVILDIAENPHAPRAKIGSPIGQVKQHIERGSPSMNKSIEHMCQPIRSKPIEPIKVPTVIWSVDFIP